TIPHNLSSSLDPMDDFFNHISAGELLDDHLEYDEQTSNWGFTVFSDKIKICLGNTEKTMWIPRDPDTNIGWFKKGWYLCYCEHHGYSYTYEA
ncbi:MAG: hypothetical protein WCG04_01850, partial [Alphaproteobacteria bacterium]